MYRLLCIRNGNEVTSLREKESNTDSVLFRCRNWILNKYQTDTKYSTLEKWTPICGELICCAAVCSVWSNIEQVLLQFTRRSNCNSHEWMSFASAYLYTCTVLSICNVFWWYINGRKKPTNSTVSSELSQSPQFNMKVNNRNLL